MLVELGLISNSGLDSLAAFRMAESNNCERAFPGSNELKLVDLSFWWPFLRGFWGFWGSGVSLPAT